MNDLELRRYNVELPAFFLSDALQLCTAAASFLFFGNIVDHIDRRKIFRKLGAFRLLSGMSRYLDILRNTRARIVRRLTFVRIEEPALLKLIATKLFTFPSKELLLPERYLVGENFIVLAEEINLFI